MALDRYDQLEMKMEENKNNTQRKFEEERNTPELCTWKIANEIIYHVEN